MAEAFRRWTLSQDVSNCVDEGEAKGEPGAGQQACLYLPGMLNRHLAPLTVNIVPDFLAQYMKQQYHKYVHLFKETMKSVWLRQETDRLTKKPMIEK